MPSKTVAIIPARMASTRFPGKPLAPLLGLPMIEHVRRRVALCSLLDRVYVATCDLEIKKVVEAGGGKVLMTSSRHQRCSDRVAEAARQIQADIILNIQGDEPLIGPQMVEALARPMQRQSDLLCANLMAPIKDTNEFENPNVIKVVCDKRGSLLYASREPIPSRRSPGSTGKISAWKQTGFIAFRSSFLQKFSSLGATPLEEAESIDMLRVIEHGLTLKMIAANFLTLGVDVPADIYAAERILAKDPLVDKYCDRAAAQ